MPCTGPWEASVSCTDVLFPGGGGFLLLLLLTPSSGLSRLRCVIRTPGRQAGFLTPANPGPLMPAGSPLRGDGPARSPAPLSLQPHRFGGFLHLWEWGLGSGSSLLFGAESVGAEHP